MSDLIPIENVNAIELFDSSKPILDELLGRIRAETAKLVPDVSSASGRKEIASLAHKIARSKTTIDDAGKQLVAKWKEKSKVVDNARKKARDYLDELKTEVRKPLDDYEAEQARIEAEKLAAEKAKREAEEAARLAEIERREAEIREREEAIARAEEEAKAKAAAEQAAKEQAEREQRIREEAEAAAKREAAEAVERAKRAEIEAVERAKAAAEQAEKDKAEAVRQAEAKAAREAAEREAQRLADVARAKAEEDRRAADRKHRAKINNAALSAFTAAGLDAEIAKRVVTLIASDSIPNVTINY